MLLFKLAVVLTYTGAPTEAGDYEPSYLLRLIGGWDDIAAVEDAALALPDRADPGPCPALEKLLMAEAADPEDDGDEFGKLRHMRAGRWEQDFVVRMMRGYERSLELLDEMMEEREIRLEVPSYGQAGPNHIFTVLGFSRIYHLRTRMRWVGGAWEEAVDSLADHNRYANFVMKSPGPLINLLVGLAIERTMLEAAEEILQEPGLPPEEMVRIREILQDGPNRRADAIRTWKHEYQYQKEVVGAFANGLTYDPYWMYSALMETEPGPLAELRAAAHRCVQQLGIAVAFQPNRAIRRGARLAEFAIAVTGLTHAERSRVEMPGDFSGDRTWRDYLHSNGVAEFLMRDVAFHSIMKALERIDHVASYREALLALWSVRRFQQLHQRLPASLREVVPGLLPAIPRDPYDGRSVRYSEANGRIWVVGEDLKDNGGMEKVLRGFRSTASPLTDTGDGYDPTLYLKWQETYREPE